MKKILVPAIGAVLSGCLMTAAYAGENDGIGQKGAMQSAQTGTSIQPSQKEDAASRYTKSKIERNKRAREKSSALKSSVVGTMPSKSGTSVVEWDKRRYANQKRAADRRAAELKKAEKARKPATSGSSVVERDKKRYDAQKRAAARRAAEMKKADKAAANTDAVKQEPKGAQEQPPAK